MRDRRKHGRPPCPHCSSDWSKVIDSGLNTGPVESFARLRQCLECDHRWKTLEINSTHHIWVENTHP
jgi:transcriptional regulator NrdR family protein